MKHTHRRRRRNHSGFFLLLLFLVLIPILGVGFRYFLDEPPAASAAPSDLPTRVSPALDLPASDSPIPEPLNTREDSADPADLASDPYPLTQLGEDAIYTGDLVLVNNNIPYHFPEEQPLVSIYSEKSKSYYVKDNEVELSPVAMEALNRMMDAFREQGGSKSVMVVAGYRTEELQEHLFEQSARRNGQAHADRFVAQPSGSEHHTGLVVDFEVYSGGSYREYDGTGEHAWINTNCQNYGWVVRYDGDKEDITGIGEEPWHFRYVGVPHAIAMTAQGLCLEEYIDYLKNFPYDGQHLVVDCAEGKYEIWYCEGTEAYLPDEGEYTVSGNNVDGVVVTWKIG